MVFDAKLVARGADTRAVIQSFFAAVRVKDREGVRALLAKDATLTNAITGEVVAGDAAVVAALWIVVDAFPDLRPEVTNLVTEGAQGVVETVRTGTHTGELRLPGRTIGPTGRKVRLPECIVFHVEDGRIAAMKAYIDRLAVAERLGFDR